MKRTCVSCSRNAFLTFLEAVTGVQRSKTLLPASRQFARALSSAISRRSNTLVPDTSGSVLGNHDSNILASNFQQPYRSEDNATAWSSNRRTIDTKSWKTQRQLLFGSTRGAYKKSGSSSTKATKRSSRLGSKNAVNSSTNPDLRSEEPSTRVNLYQSSTVQRKGRRHDQSAGDQGPDRSQSNEYGTSTTIAQETLSQGPPAPRKKDRWRNRVAVDGLQKSAHPEETASNREFTRSHQVQTQQNQNPSGQQSAREKEKTPSDTIRPQTRSPALNKELPAWKVHKRAVKTKLNGSDWRPLKRLSPDAREGVKQLHSEDPVLWSTAHLAEHFQISPDAIRRILKSKWKPTEKEKEEQQERWIRRGETIWDRYVELGRKAPRRWRGLNPMPAPKLQTAAEKVEFKPEEWSQDPPEDVGKSSGLGPGLGNRIL